MRAAVSEAWNSLEADPRRSLAVALSLGVLLRIPFLSAPLQPDEGGFLMVARQWTADGSALYGDQWVDRPPLLIVIFRLAATLGGDPVTLRILALLFGAATVVAAWWAGRVINGPRGALAAAVVAAAISSSYKLDGFALTGEAIAVAMVMTSCALTLDATYSSRTSRQAVVLALGSGILAAMAFLVKQSFVDAGLFAFVLLSMAVPRSWRVFGAGAVGVALPLVVTAAWAGSDAGPGLVKLWNAVFRFRQRAFEVMQNATDTAPQDRLNLLVQLFVTTGLILLSLQLFAALRRRAENPPALRPALLVMFAYSVAAVLVGGSWWSHYLLQLGPVLALGTASATRRPLPRLGPRVTAAAVALASIWACVTGVRDVANAQLVGTTDEIVGLYLRDASKPGDSVVLAYGRASVIETSGLSTPYKYSWSLPVRARDSHLTTLVATLSGDSAPTWLVEIGEFDWWGLDNAAFRQVRASGYHVVATVCEHDVYLRDGLVRSLPPTPSCP
ncbi:MAG: hypothetical protein H0U51_02275 [Propionibacteriales bacterium]|nr:hypothetical protein [Propionibacteriales bacterium]